MNKQNLYNANNLQRIGSQLYYLEIDANPVDPQVQDESQPTIPLNVLVNGQNNHFLVVKGKNQESPVCVYVEPTVEDNTLLSYINNQRFSVDVNSDSIHHNPNPEPSSSAPVDLAESQVILIKTNEHKTAQDVNVESYINLLKNGASEDHLSRDKPTKIKGFVHISDRVVPARAVAVLPPSLHLRRGSVIPRRSLPQRVRFGPVQGINQAISFSDRHYMVQNASTSKTPIFLLKNNNGVTHIDVSDKDKSNWIGLLPLGNENTANVWLYEEEGKLYGITIKSLPAGTPLTIGYSKSYAQDHSIPHDQPIMDICKDFEEDQGRWWCYECLRAYTKLSLLERHINQCHTDDVALLRRKYRCRHCTRTFSRLSTLKRHIARYCNYKSKTAEKPDELKKTPTVEPLNISLNIEDNRLPSDESLQNYTNGLDFSTSLFDTDRMPSFDISGSSRSETEFNPYGISYRYDHELTSGTGFEKLSNDLNKSQSSYSEQTKEQARTEEMKQTKEQMHVTGQTATVVETEAKEQTHNESLLISCPYCKQTIIREKKREHLSGCTERRLECECGRSFSSKEQLAKHIHAVHSNSDQAKPVTDGTTHMNTLEYRCETCQCLFKRRGMLVNHLWRVHKSSAAVPLERRVRHYPCAACPKVYRTAAKRNSHQTVHHPDVCASAAGARYAIEGGRRCVAPAACGACPRQYATRAKLLQHVRQAHPDLAPPKQMSKGKSASQNNHTKPAT